MPSVISGDANVSATEFGFLDGVTSGLQSQIDAKLPLAGGKILQIVRATDSTERTTTSNVFVDANITVTITPQKSDSAILLVWTGLISNISDGSTTPIGNVQITDNSNNSISGAEQLLFTYNTTLNLDVVQPFSSFAYSTPATTSATTYKGRFSTGSGGGRETKIRNNVNTGQMYAIEVSA